MFSILYLTDGKSGVSGRKLKVDNMIFKWTKLKSSFLKGLN